MQNHRFAVGEIVLCTERRHPHFSWRAPYTIMTCIKAETTEPQYRIASVHRHEIRIAGEHELCRTPQPLAARQPPHGRILEALPSLQPANLNLKPALERPLSPCPQHSGTGEHHP